MSIAMHATGRERFVRVAADLFTRFGFGPVGLDQVIASAGVTKTTFYKHFESKDELILAVLDHQHAVEMAVIKQEVEQAAPGDPRRQILEIFQFMDHWFSAKDFRGCMFLNAANEFPMASDPIHKAAQAHGDAMGKFIREKAIAAGATRARAAEFSQEALMLVRGAVVSRQTANMMDAAKRAGWIAEVLLDRALAE